MLENVNDVIEALGGPTRAAILAGVSSPSAISNWKARGRIPAENWLMFSMELSKINLRAHPKIFGLKRDPIVFLGGE